MMRKRLWFSSFAVAVVSGNLNSQPDPKITDYQAQINWGDSDQWDKTDLAKGASEFLVKGSHIYAQAGSYQTMPTLDANLWNLIRFQEQELESGGAIYPLFARVQFLANCYHSHKPFRLGRYMVAAGILTPSEQEIDSLLRD